MTLPFFIEPQALQRAVAVLQRGEIIAHPTETLFGLAVDPFNPTALARLLRLKGSNPGQATRKGFILLLPGAECIKRLLLPPSALAQQLMARFWPGPLTLVLPARPGLPPQLTGGGTRLAVRHSPAPLVTALMAVWKNPLVSTSANISGQPPLNSGIDIHQQWGAAVSLVLEDGVQNDMDHNALPSTILQVEGERVCLLRAGAVSREALLAIMPNLNLLDDAETAPR